MTNTELFDLLGQIDSKYYDEVFGGDPEQPIKLNIAKRPFSIKRLILPIAACLVLAIGAGVTVNYLKHSVFISDISVEAKKLYLDEYPELKQYENSGLAVRSRVMDINCDGTDEIFVVTGTGEAPPQIYSETESGIEKTGELELTKSGTRLTDPDQLFCYDEDGEKYWFYSYICYNGDDILVHAAARINYDGGNYFTDFPIGYGTLDAYGSGKKYAKDLQFSLNDGLPFNGYVIGKLFDEISADEFKILWGKHKDLPNIINDFYDEFPELPLSEDDIPVVDSLQELGMAIPKARLSVLFYGEYEVWLLGENVYRCNDGYDYIRSKSMKLALVKGNKIISEESIRLKSAEFDDFGYIRVDCRFFDNYFQLYRLANVPIITFTYRSDRKSAVDLFGDESNFFTVKHDSIISLAGRTAPDSEDISIDAGASAYLSVQSNSLVDINKGVTYSFDPNAFDKDPDSVPHFITQKTASGFLDVGNYTVYDPSSSEMVTQALITEKQCGDYTIKLLGHNVQTVKEKGQPITNSSELYISLVKDNEETSRTKIDPGNLYAQRLNDYIFTFEMKDGIGFGIASYWSFDNARLYSIKGGKPINFNMYNAVEINSTISGFAEGYNIIQEKNKIDFIGGGSIVLDFQLKLCFDGEEQSAVKGGKVYVTGKEPGFDLPLNDIVCGTETEWQRWKDIINSKKIARIDVSKWYTENELKLSDAAAAYILDMLANAEMQILDEWDDPPTGGSDEVFAFDENGDLIFYVIFDGYSLSIRFADDADLYTFNGKDCGLNNLSSLMPEDSPY